MARTKQKNHALAEKIGKIIRTQRELIGLTQAQLAEEVGLEDETISRMENGHRLPTIEKLIELAEVLKLPVASFFDDASSGKVRKSAESYAQKISHLLNDLPDTGRDFVLKVAQDYAKYHMSEGDK